MREAKQWRFRSLFSRVRSPNPASQKDFCLRRANHKAWRENGWYSESLFHVQRRRRLGPRVRGRVRPPRRPLRFPSLRNCLGERYRPRCGDHISRQSKKISGSPFFQATLRHVPEASGKIVFDRFHIMGHVGKAVGTVRKREVRDGGVPELKGSKYLWLY